jgi:transposase
LSPSEFLAAPTSLVLQKTLSESQLVTLVLESREAVRSCPKCKTPSSRVHSRYMRTLTDLPCPGRTVRLQLQVRRFSCTASTCPKKTFAERFPKIAKPYARTTARLQKAHFLIAKALGGEAGARLAAPLGMPTSPDTLLRRVKSWYVERSAQVRVLGVDDWAWKKGQRYGTLLCDLERRRVVDLLPERSAHSLARWLKKHPGVEVVSRDRADEYIKGASQGAPQAVQVADRFHLLVNVREALVRLLDRHHAQVSQAAKTVATGLEESSGSVALQGATAGVPQQTAPLSRKAQGTVERRARRLARYQCVIELHQQGVPLRGIARRVGLHRETVRRWIGAGAFPERVKRPTRSRAARFHEHLQRRWHEGCHNIARLTEELRELGYRGSHHTVRRRVAQWRQGDEKRAAKSQPKPTFRTPSSRRVSWWLLIEDAQLETKQRSFLEVLWARCPELKNASELAREFSAMVRNRLCRSWDAWLARAHDRTVARELRNFAAGLKRDESAVKSALSLEWSNGQVEGQINRLKMLKRQMFGRAGFALLRGRLLRAG